MDKTLSRWVVTRSENPMVVETHLVQDRNDPEITMETYALGHDVACMFTILKKTK
jgi:hypothetical protein